MIFDEARAVADAVLLEGYALYPYRASALKNRYRWQFGVLTPRGWSESGGSDPWWQQTECLVQVAPPPAPAPRLQGKLRFLQLHRRRTDPGAPLAPWDEADVREVDFDFALEGEATRQEQIAPFRVSGEAPVSGVIRLAIDVLPVPEPALRLHLRVENVTAWALPGVPRDEALHASLLGAHLLLAVSGGAFLSLLDPPAWAAAAAASCRNIGTYPVLAGKRGRRDLVLSAPIILGDYPAVAPESPRDLFDASEIDEILTLRILTLTDEEKREVRVTDPRLAALLDGVERLRPEELARLHGATRELRPLDESPPRQEPPAPLQIEVGGVTIGPGSRVRLRPGPRRSDAQDMFLAGLTATVEAIMRDVEDGDCLAVTVDDDPAFELQLWRRQFLYFRPDEVEPLEATERSGADP